MVGRTVRHQQYFGAAFRQCLAYCEVAPDILTDRNADPYPTKIDGPTDLGPRVKHPLFVKLAIVGQVHLVALRQHPSAISHNDGIMRAACALQGHPHDHARPPIGRVLRKIERRSLARSQERRLKDEVLLWIASQKKL